MTDRRWLVGVLLVLAGLSGCHGKDAVRVRLTFDAPAGSRPLANVTVWPIITAGDSVSMTLPPEGEPPEIFMKYTAGPAPREWRGPPILRGVGYAIAIRVASDGSVTERHCQSPCDLP
jgi:hypothetical protein